ncbi:MAG: hypothetical protein UV98_C0004G0003 [Parcubacteria group bacterium GW2011_GWB1_43_6]|nr:MAG: hypothetical protein UV98_C0004G0003 [Parcubacteria group bacterium GW2011_GWB1_43_6]
MVRKITALVTGGCGFIGSHIVDELVRRKYEVIVIDNLSTGHRANLNTKAKFYRRDVTKFSQIKKLFRGADFVFHAAALARIQPSIKDPRKTFDVNVLGTFNVLLSAKDAGVKKVIYSASSSVYGDQSGLPLKENMISHPKNMYALSKLFGEDMCKVFSRLYGLNTVSLRYFNVYGPRQLHTGAYATVIGVFLKQWASGKPLTITGDGKIRRDFTHISDVVCANLLAMRSAKACGGEIINIGSGKNYSINEVAATVLNSSKGLSVVYIPPRPAESKVTLADVSKARRLLSWKPRIDFKKGLEMTRRHYLGS